MSDRPPMPSRDGLASHQVWVWMNGIEEWQIRGTGVIVDPLFVSWLRDTRELQKLSYGRDPNELDGDDREKFILWNAYAAIDEIGESTDEISWKPWASAKFFNRDQYVNELVDVLHFVANMLCAADCSDAELDRRYRAKMQKNRARMANGYTGREKCTLCKRALDDIGASDIHVDDDPTKVLCTMCASRYQSEYGTKTINDIL